MVRALVLVQGGMEEDCNLGNHNYTDIRILSIRGQNFAHFTNHPMNATKISRSRAGVFSGFTLGGLGG